LIFVSTALIFVSLNELPRRVWADRRHQWNVWNEELDAVAPDTIGDLPASHAFPVGKVRILFHAGPFQTIPACAYRKIHILTFVSFYESNQWIVAS
jgi:hypothetical protein